MKKFFALILSAVCVFSFAGCGKNDVDNFDAPMPDVTFQITAEATPTETPEATPGVTPKVTPGTTPEATPEVTPKATPKTTPTVTPEATPDTSKGTAMYVTGDSVNVRKGPSTSTQIVTSLNIGYGVTMYSEADGWAYIRYDSNKYGYISAQYLSKTAPLTPAPTAKPTATPLVTSTPATTATPEVTPTITPVITPTPEVTPTITPVITPTPTSEVTPTPKPTDGNISLPFDPFN